MCILYAHIQRTLFSLFLGPEKHEARRIASYSDMTDNGKWRVMLEYTTHYLVQESNSQKYDRDPNTLIINHALSHTDSDMYTHAYNIRIFMCIHLEEFKFQIHENIKVSASFVYLWLLVMDEIWQERTPINMFVYLFAMKAMPTGSA